MNKLTLKQPYSLTVGNYNVSLAAHRIMIRMIQKLQPYLISKSELGKDPSKNQRLILKMRSLLDEENQNDSTIKDALEEMNRMGLATDLLGDKIVKLETRSLLPKGSQNYSTIKDALKELRKVNVTIKTDKEVIFTGLISEAKYLNNNSIVSIKISGSILPHYLMIAKGYTKYSLPVAFELSSRYTIRLYMMLSHWQDQSNLNIMIDDLRGSLQLGEKYKESAHFKKFIILPTQRELKEKADIWFEIQEPIKNSRKVTGWKLKICKRKNSSLLSHPIENTNKTIIKDLYDKFKLSIRQAKKIELEVRKNPKIIKQLAKELYEISLRIANREIKNVGGYTKKVIEQRFGIEL